jgi:diguanylate cyclase (GGDEF)-like protein
VSLSSNSTARQLIFPNGLLVLAGLCSIAIAPAVDRSLLDPARFASAALLLACAMLAVRLRSLRVFLALLSLTAFLAVVSLAHIAVALLPFLVVLMALDLALILFVEDSFFDWLAVAWWSGLLFVQWTVLIAAVRWDASAFVSIAANRITLPFFSFGVPELLVVFAGLALIGKFLYAPDSVGAGLLWAMVAVTPGLRGSSQMAMIACVVLSGAVLAVSSIERSHWIAYHDELTGLPGRRAFNEALAALGDHYAIAIVDVDHFKKFNDTFGHETGDQVLRKVASQLSRVGGGGMAFRCGGEEFALVFPDSPMDEAFDHAEDVRASIAEDGFIARGPSRSQRERDDRRVGPRRKLHDRAIETNVTVSIGIAEGAARFTPSDVVEAADKALYRAKNNGRNRVERALTAAPKLRRRRAPASEQEPVIRS